MSETPKPHLGALFREAVRTPRRSMRRMLLAGFAEHERLMMVALGALISALGLVVMSASQPPEAVGAPPPGPVGGGLVLTLIAAFLQYVIVSAAAFWAGRAFGGVADFEATRMAVAWWTLITAPLQAAQAASIRMIETPAGGFLLMLSSGIMVWLLAAYIAEAHRFARTGVVALGVLMAVFALMMAAATVMPASQG